MSTTQNLKFIHLGSNVAATNNTANAGAIIFEPKSGRIAVQGTSKLEYYGGGRIADAKFDENRKLTLSFNDGSDPIVLDFSDTASASGVDKILGKLRYDVDALKATVNGTDKDGSHTPGLVDKVKTNTTDIAANTAAIAVINDETDGILAKAKTYTNTKISDLKGVGADDDETLKKLRDSITTLEGKHADGKTVAQEIIDKVGTGITGTVEAYVEGKVSTINKTTAGLRTDVDGLKGRADTLEGRATALEGRATALEGRADALEADVEANAEAIAAINHETTGILAQAKSYTDDAKKAANDYTDGEVVKINTAADALGTRVTTLEGKVGGLETTVGKAAANGEPATGLHKDIADLQALHATKNGAMMTVAAEAEAAAATAVANVIAGAPEDFDTLKEIADWIASDKTGSAQMTADIDALKKTVGDEKSGLVKGVADNKSSINAHDGRITKLEALHASGNHDGYSTVAEEVKAGIAGIAEASVTSDDGTDVKVTVKTAAGSVSDVIVDASVLRGAVDDNAEAIAAETVRATGVEGDLKTSLDAVSGALGEKADVSTKDTAFGRIKALEEKQADGALMWFDWQN